MIQILRVMPPSYDVELERRIRILFSCNHAAYFSEVTSVQKSYFCLLLPVNGKQGQRSRHSD